MLFFLKSAGLVLAYVVAAKLGLDYGRVQGVAVFWPPGGIALGAVLLGGVRYLPAVGLAAWLAAFAVDAPPLFAIGSTLGNLLETTLAYLLLTRVRPCRTALTRLKDLLSIVLLGGGLATVASALLGPWSLFASGLIPAADLPETMWRWWRSDMLGIAFLTPLVLLFAHRRPYFSARISWLETSLLWAAASLTGAVIFLGWVHPWLGLERPAQLAWLFPILFWAGLRTGRRNTVLIQVLLMAQAMAGAYLGRGVFADTFQNYDLVGFWLAAMALALIPLSLAILTREHWHASLKTALHAKVFTLSNDAVVICDSQDNIISINPAFTHITGYTHDDVMGKKPAMYGSGQHGKAFFDALWDTLLATDQWEGDIWNRRKSGELFLEKLSIRTLRDADGRVVNRMGIFSDVTESRAAQDVVKHQAQHDFLTNLPNRLLFTDRFGQQLAQARRNDAKFAVIYLDLDGFKGVNDRLGHAVGDDLLVAVAQRLTELVREVDTVSRLGGDEFAVLVCDVSTNEDVITLAEKMLDRLGKEYLLASHNVAVTASLGLAIYPFHGQDMATLVNAADDALRQAKEEGKNGWQISEADWSDSQASEQFQDALAA
jgi:diguanylate cyclase (GGDEF)-like protein/PAS domain S-box-containing protein